MTPSRSAARPPEAPPDALGRLIETEVRLEEMLAERRREAAAIVVKARVEAEALGTRLRQEIGSVLALRQREIEAGTERALTELQGEAARTVERYRAVTPEAVEEAARLVIDRILGFEDAGPP